MMDDALQRFAAVVMADRGLTTHLTAIADSEAFVDQALQIARAKDIVLSASRLRAATQPDPLGLARWSASPFTAPVLPSNDWLPIAATVADGAIYVDWAWFGAQALRLSFYEDEIRRVLHLPFNRVFRHRTRLDEPSTEKETANPAKPDGLIFHMSRCGSTLAARMLATLDDSVVVSEAEPINAVVQFGGNAAPGDAVRALRSIVATFGRPRGNRSGHPYILKLDCWHTLALPLFQRAFPDVPWIFLYRDPVEVLVSQIHQRGMQMVPQFFPPAFFGIADSGGLTDEDYCARVLAVICRSVLDHWATGRALALDYRQLPNAVLTAVLPHFGISCSAAERWRMQQAASWNSKSPSLPFASDLDAKQQSATPAIRRAAERHLGDIYKGLEALNRTRQLNVA